MDQGLSACACPGQVEIPRHLWKADPERQLKWCAHRWVGAGVRAWGAARCGIEFAHSVSAREQGAVVAPWELFGSVCRFCGSRRQLAARGPLANRSWLNACMLDPHDRTHTKGRCVEVAFGALHARVCCLRAGKFAEKVMKSTAELETVVAIVAANERQMRRHDPLRKYMDIIVAHVEKVRKGPGVCALAYVFGVVRVPRVRAFAGMCVADAVREVGKRALQIRRHKRAVRVQGVKARQAGARCQVGGGHMCILWQTCTRCVPGVAGSNWRFGAYHGATRCRCETVPTVRPVLSATKPLSWEQQAPSPPWYAP